MQKQIIDFLKGIKNYLKKKFNHPDSKWPYFITATVALAVVIIGIILFVKLTHRTMSELLQDYDTAITQSIQSYRSPFLTDYLIAVTEIGDVWGYAVVFTAIIVTFLLVFRSWKYILQLTSVLVLALSSNVLLKQIINRARPSGEHLVTVETLSYPSGHAMLSMAFYGFLIYLFYQFKMHIVIKSILITLFALLILSIGISRIYLGVHYPSDVVGGYLAGIIWLILCIVIFDLIKIFRRDPET
ncbi:phosphatase PAP2 family protein [Winogradskyella ursingii]|uniref:phosphatase PAP2 family protein n=1 Tax=Winogradskyella ursingii TaxID=2686079 RepID=UPI0015CB116D|nr:phosphatase PAP2 family protein [Winogradskyella ursingii]